MQKSRFMILMLILMLLISNMAIAGGRYYYERGHNKQNYGHGGGYYPQAILGGLIVGGIIASNINQPHYRRPVYVNYYPASVSSGSRFLLEPNGNCFLISQNSSGNQILSSVPTSNCK